MTISVNLTKPQQAQMAEIAARLHLTVEQLAVSTWRSTAANRKAGVLLLQRGRREGEPSVTDAD